jgi:hypothetical protein
MFFPPPYTANDDFQRTSSELYSHFVVSIALARPRRLKVLLTSQPHPLREHGCSPLSSGSKNLATAFQRLCRDIEGSFHLRLTSTDPRISTTSICCGPLAKERLARSVALSQSPSKRVMGFAGPDCPTQARQDAVCPQVYQ